MNSKTAGQLIHLNQIFYELMAVEFNSTRKASWQGFENVWDTITPTLPESPDILDIGCGNGRFGTFLMTKIGQNFSYTGIDQNQYLLNQARRSLKGLKVLKLYQKGIIPPKYAWRLPLAQYQIISVFGVLHHIPGNANRKKLISHLSRLLVDHGFLVISLWQFLDDPRERKKILPWEYFKIDSENLENNDFLLDWQNKGVPRYCHYIDQHEIKELIDKIPHRLVADFLADGKSGKLNRYLVWRNFND